MLKFISTILSARPRAVALVAALSLVSACAYAAIEEWTSNKAWPEPLVVDPGPPGGPPADAIVLFDGADMSAWNNADHWEVKDGVVTVRARPGGQRPAISTKESFGDCQLHLEFATPERVRGFGQQRGNSGVYLMGKYEVQILDSHDNTTYFDGQCGAIYKQCPPQVNVCRKPGEWQTYDILFEAPRFDNVGNLTRPAYVTVLHNGVVIHNHTELEGGTFYHIPPQYEAHEAKLPLRLQDHGNPVKFRNIWIRELKPQKYTLK